MTVPKIDSDLVHHGRRRILLLVLGYLFFGVGLLGTVVPVLPTTVFWIIAALCFARSSPRMYQRILAWPSVGGAVADYVNAGVIQPRGKMYALAGMILAAIAIVLTPLGTIATFAALGGVAVGAVYVVSRPSRTDTHLPR